VQSAEPGRKIAQNVAMMKSDFEAALELVENNYTCLFFLAALSVADCNMVNKNKHINSKSLSWHSNCLCMLGPPS
jgi:hypothetical protein